MNRAETFQGEPWVCGPFRWPGAAGPLSAWTVREEYPRVYPDREAKAEEANEKVLDALREGGPQTPTSISMAQDMAPTAVGWALKRLAELGAVERPRHLSNIWKIVE